MAEEMTPEMQAAAVDGFLGNPPAVGYTEGYAAGLAARGGTDGTGSSGPALRVWMDDRWVKVADLDMTPELAAAAEGSTIPLPEIMAAVLLYARQKPRALVCRYCGSPLQSTIEPRPGHGQYDEPGPIECAGPECYASWRSDGTPLTDQNGGPIDA